MDRWDPVTVVGVLVVLVLVGAGPLTGVDVSNAQSSTVGEGNATVESLTVEQSALTVTDGRFGTNVSYLRIPPATVTLGSVTGRPQLVYLVSSPALDVDRVETLVVTSEGSYRLNPDDKALAPGTESGEYRVSITVRLQSFSTEQVLLRTNETVEVSP